MKDYLCELVNRIFGLKLTIESDCDVSLLDLDISAEQALYVVVQFSKKFEINLKEIYNNAQKYSINELCEIGLNNINTMSY